MDPDSARAERSAKVVRPDGGQGVGRPLDDRELGSYFRVTPEIVRFIPELLQDLWELGSNPELVAGWLGEAGLAGEAVRVLDLGCGKGAVSIAVAQRLGCRVHGVDAMPEFLDTARQEALRLGLADLCSFEVGDLRETVRQARDYDAVLLVSVGVLGSPASAVTACRKCVVPGGLLVIDDGYLQREGQLEFPGYEALFTRDETLRQLISHGDRIIREQVFPVESVRDQNRRYMRWIEHRAEQLAASHPEHADDFRAYVASELEECALLETTVTCATWMLQRA